ncbi:SAM-dependent methyltransferase [Verrucomicrobia bacterium]|nr:SAM-dependent methyltransferase [Verrucomicrobiota bacterium]|tara:strand:- start:2307 stop:3452 length:1146 start_codon:yes stop_codon:yes gene_type:complete
MSEQATDNGQSANKNSIMGLIHEKIHESDSALPFDEFMELALYHPNYGYYTSARKRVGSDGDFITSVSVGQCFGMILAHHFAPIIESMASNSDEVVIVELGAEEGDLAKDVMGTLSELLNDSIFKRLRYIVVEPFVAKRAELHSKFISGGLDKFEVISNFSELSVKNCILIANEVLDAIPVKRVRWNGNEWVEICVSAVDCGEGQGLVATEKNIESLALKEIVKDYPTTLTEGFTVEVNLRLNDFFADIFPAAEILYGCLIDYGLEADEIFDPGRKNGTLRAYSKHGIIDDPLSLPGRIDLTSHVNFDHASSVAKDCGFEVSSITDQYHFLVKSAEPWLLEIEKGGDPNAETAKLLRQFKMLFHPSVMGQNFKVMEIKKGI